MTDYEEKRGHSTERCPTGYLPAISFAKLNNVQEKYSANLVSPVHILKRFASVVFEERTGRRPQPEDSIRLRENDDLAVAAIFGADVAPPGVNDQARTEINTYAIESLRVLGVLATESNINNTAA